MGQLHGGQASCSFNFNDYYGKVSASWDWGNSSSNRLKDWLDPEDTGTLVLDSYDTGSAGELAYTPDFMHFEMSVNETDASGNIIDSAPIDASGNPFDDIRRRVTNLLSRTTDISGGNIIAADITFEMPLNNDVP